MNGPSLHHQKDHPLGVALVTGAAHRIGKAIATHLAEQGWSVAIHYHHSEQTAAGFATTLRGRHPGQQFEIFGCDLSDAPPLLDLIPAVIEKMGIPRLLVNNASVFEPGTLMQTNPGLLEHHLAVNLKAPLFLIQRFAALCGRGLIINVADTRITTDKFNYAAYSLSKKALWELTRMAAAELGPAIRVNAVAPGLILPPEGKDETYLLNLARNIVMKKPGGLKPIVQSIDFMLSNDYLTGQLIFCDGGENLR